MVIETHHVAEAAGIEQSVGTGSHSLGGITFHETERLEALDSHAGREVINVFKTHAGLEGVDRSLMCSDLNVVDFLLARGEFLVGRDSRRHVATIVTVGQLGTGIKQEKVAGVDGVGVDEVVKRLAMGGGNSGERSVAVLSLCDCLDGGKNLVFLHAGTHDAIGLEVHVGSHVAGLVYLDDFLGSLVIAQVNNALDKGD